MSYESTLTEDANIYPATGTDDYGKATYGAAVATKCRVVLKGTTKYGGAGGANNSTERVVIAAVARLPRTTTVVAGDKFVHDGVTYKVEGKRRTPNHAGQIFALNVELSQWPSL